MKHALIILYDGVFPEKRIQKTTASVLADYGVIHDLDSISIYVMDETAILQAMLSNAVGSTQNTNIPDPKEWAASVLFDQFKEAIIATNYEEFSTALAIKLAIELEKNTDLVKAVKILAKEETESALSDEVKSRYGLCKNVFQIIRRDLYLVCQGRHVIIR